MPDAYSGPERRGSSPRRDADRDDVLRQGRDKSESLRAIRGLTEKPADPVRDPVVVDAFTAIMSDPRLAHVADYMVAAQTHEAVRTPESAQALVEAAAIVCDDKLKSEAPLPMLDWARAVRVNTATTQGIFAPHLRRN